MRWGVNDLYWDGDELDWVIQAPAQPGHLSWGEDIGWGASGLYWGDISVAREGGLQWGDSPIALGIQGLQWGDSSPVVPAIIVIVDSHIRPEHSTRVLGYGNTVNIIHAQTVAIQGGEYEWTWNNKSEVRPDGVTSWQA